MVAQIEENLEQKKFETAQRILEQYGEMLHDHIAAENEELFPMASTLFSASEIEKLANRFEDCDREKGWVRKSNLSKDMNLILQQPNKQL